MLQKLPVPPAGFDELSAEEKIEYVQLLWDRLAAKPEEVPVPEWHRRVLDERLAAYRANPEEGRSWEEVREEVLRKLRDRSLER